MKLIIDIPEDALKEMKTKEFISIESIDTAIECIQNGIPLDDVKAEIKMVMDMYKGCEYIGDKARRDELWHVLEILDNIGKAESEDKR